MANHSLQEKNKDVRQIISLLLIFAIIIIIYNATYKDRYGNFLSSFKITDVPESIKCFFGEDNCDEGDIDGWTLCHGLMYFIIGLIVPKYYLTIIGLSIGFELIQPYLGNNARYIVNPLVNLTGYSLGSLLSTAHHNKSFKEKYQVIESDL